MATKRTIKELRILPPFAIARLGSADTPMDNYTIEVDVAAGEKYPLDYRIIKMQPTLFVNQWSGEIEDERTPSKPQFKEGEDNKPGRNAQENTRDRPVAPFLEVFAIVEGDDALVPLTTDLLKSNGLGVDDISWRVRVANRKVARRTGDDADIVHAELPSIKDHKAQPLRGTCKNFVNGGHVDFGPGAFHQAECEIPGNPPAFHAGERLDLWPRIGCKPVRTQVPPELRHAGECQAGFPRALSRSLKQLCAVYDDKKNNGQELERLRRSGPRERARLSPEEVAREFGPAAGL